MHLADGVLPLAHTLVYDGMAGAVVAVGVKKYYKASEGKLDYKILSGAFAAFVFMVTVFEIPIPLFGSSEHPTGTPLVAIFMGPFVTPLISTIVLLLELLFKEGGITTLGANVLSLGVVGALTGWGIFNSLRKLRLGLFTAAFFAGFIGDLTVYLMTAVQLALGNSVSKSFMYYFMTFVPVQIPLALLEGVFTGLVLKFISKRRPDILKEFGIMK